MAFGVARQFVLPRRARRPVFGRCLVFVDCPAPDLGDARDIGRSALASLDFQCDHPSTRQLRQQAQRIETGRFFQRMEYPASNVETPFADGWISGRFAFDVAIDQHAVQSHRAAAVVLFLPLDEARG